MSCSGVNFAASNASNDADDADDDNDDDDGIVDVDVVVVVVVVVVVSRLLVHTAQVTRRPGLRSVHALQLHSWLLLTAGTFFLAFRRV